MSRQRGWAIPAVLIGAGVLSYYLWPVLRAVRDPMLKRAETGRAAVRVGQSQSQVLLATLPFLGRGAKGGLVFVECRDPDLIVSARFDRSGVLRHLSRSRMQATETSHPTPVALAEALASDREVASCRSGQLGFGDWTVRLEFSAGAVSSIGEVEYGG